MKNNSVLTCKQVRESGKNVKSEFATLNYCVKAFNNFVNEAKSIKIEQRTTAQCDAVWIANYFKVLDAKGVAKVCGNLGLILDGKVASYTKRKGDDRPILRVKNTFSVAWLINVLIEYICKNVVAPAQKQAREEAKAQKEQLKKEAQTAKEKALKSAKSDSKTEKKAA